MRFLEYIAEIVYLYLLRPNYSIKKTKGRTVFYDLSGDGFHDNGVELFLWHKGDVKLNELEVKKIQFVNWSSNECVLHVIGEMLYRGEVLSFELHIKL
jgi:hypothetical protein